MVFDLRRATMSDMVKMRDQGKDENLVPFPLRLARAGIEHIETQAAELDVKPSVMARRMLAYAALHMPKHWTPNSEIRQVTNVVPREFRPVPKPSQRRSDV